MTWRSLYTHPSFNWWLTKTKGTTLTRHRPPASGNYKSRRLFCSILPFPILLLFFLAVKVVNAMAMAYTHRTGALLLPCPDDVELALVTGAETLLCPASFSFHTGAGVLWN